MTTRAKALIAGGGTGASVMYDFGRRPLAGDMLPAAVWEHLYRRAWKHQMAVDAGPGGPNPAGDLLLRQAISEYLGVTRGIRCGPEDVVVASTTQALLCAAAELWLEPGRAVVVEDPSCPGGRQGLELQGPTIIPVPVDRDGIRTDALPPEATLAVVTPSCHFPTGATMSLSRRQELLDWGRATNSLIVELDIDSHYRYSGKSLPAIHALDSADRVLYIGDLGHVLVHGIGLAFAVVPESARDAMREILVVAGHNVPHVDQRAIALLLTEGYFDRHVRRIRIVHERMRDVMLEAIRSELRSWVTVDGPEVGARMTMRLVDSPLSAPQLAKEDYRQGVRVGQIWRVSGEPDEARLSLVFAGQSPVTIWRGIRRLRKILEAA
jgi:GntR family transcriptional regulator/MocR family aminotransferase